MSIIRPIAVITGATSGIGKFYAYELAKRGYNLIITGRRIALLKETAQFLGEKYGCETKICLVDFTNTEEVQRFIDWIKTVNHIGYLVNNAGYGLENSFIGDRYEMQFDMVKVHVHASVALAHCVGLKMKKQRQGTIINVCSLAAYIPLPTSAMYAATKSFLVTFSECLYLELAPYGIKVQALCPGFVHTDFHTKLNVSPSKLKSVGPIRFMSPDQVVSISLQKLDGKNQVIVVPGAANQIGYFLFKYIPKKIYYPIVSWVTDISGKKTI